MENNKNKKSVKFQGDMLNFCDFIQVFVFTRNHHLKVSRRGLALEYGNGNYDIYRIRPKHLVTSSVKVTTPKDRNIFLNDQTLSRLICIFHFYMIFGMIREVQICT